MKKKKIEYFEGKKRANSTDPNIDLGAQWLLEQI